jgi:hypothetical protein
MNSVLQVITPSRRLLVFGGPYSNLEATEAILAEARRRAVRPVNIVCTGGLAAYSLAELHPDPNPRRASIRPVPVLG